MSIQNVHHINVVTRDLPATRAFYVEVLGLEEGPRPAFASDGYWFYAAGMPVVHVQQGAPDKAASALNHAAFQVSDLAAALVRLDAHGVRYDIVGLPNSDIQQAFFFDPNGVRLELLQETWVG